jgi:hypothetical protein
MVEVVGGGFAQQCLMGLSGFRGSGKCEGV